MVNIERLKTELRKKNVTIESASSYIGVDPATFYRRVARRGENFTVAEVEKLAELLVLDNSSIQAIFFER